jgi:hypothetical protein
MENNEHISKVFVILESITQSKAKYIEISSSDGEPIFKIKIIVEDADMVDFLDGFFDKGFKVKQITKNEFDLFQGIETLDFNLE